jgi:hypothetical protein
MMGRENPAKFEKHLQAWERLRKRGKLSFVLYKGVLLWGGLMFILTTCANVFARHDQLGRLPVFLVIDALVWCFFGSIWALWVWHRCEKRFGGPTIP